MPLLYSGTRKPQPTWIDRIVPFGGLPKPYRSVFQILITHLIAHAFSLMWPYMLGKASCFAINILSALYRKCYITFTRGRGGGISRFYLLVFCPIVPPTQPALKLEWHAMAFCCFSDRVCFAFRIVCWRNVGFLAWISLFLACVSMQVSPWKFLAVANNTALLLRALYIGCWGVCERVQTWACVGGVDQYAIMRAACINVCVRRQSVHVGVVPR